MRIKTLAFLAVALIASTQALAQERGFYLGGGLGQSTLKRWCDTSADPSVVATSCEDTDTAWKLFGGYQFMRYIGAEGFYVDWGSVSGGGTVSGAPFTASAKQQSWGAALVGTLRLGEQFWIFGKFGYVSTDQETTSTVSGSSTTRERSTSGLNYYGLGAQYRFSRNWGVRAEWEQEDELEVQMLSIGTEYRF